MTAELSISIIDTPTGGIKTLRKLIVVREDQHLVTLYTGYSRKTMRGNNIVYEWAEPGIVFPMTSSLTDAEKILLKEKLLTVHQTFQSFFFQAEITEVPYPAHT